MDLAQEILDYVKLEDRPSRFEITATGNDYEAGRNGPTSWPQRNVLKIIAPVEDGNLVWKVMYFDNHVTPRSNAKWETLCYEADNWTGAATFVDGFLQSGGRCSNAFLKLSPFNEDLEASQREVAHWFLVDRQPYENRIAAIAGVLKALLAP